jgi:hypothetical protein
MSLAVAVALAGCSGGGSKPVSLPSIQPSSPSASAITSSGAAIGVVSRVVREWFSLLASQTSIETAGALEAITTSSCKCRNAPKSVRDAVAKHEHYVGSSRIISFTPSMDGTSAAEVLVEYDYSSGGLQASDGHFVTRIAGRKHVEANFRLVLSRGRWLIATIETIREGTPA